MRGVSAFLHRRVFFPRARVERVTYQCTVCGEESQFGLGDVKFDVRTDKQWDPPGGTLLWVIVGTIVFGIVIALGW